MPTVSPERVLAVFARKYWPRVAPRVSWKYERSRKRKVREIFEARKSGTRVVVIFYTGIDLENPSSFKKDAHEACRAANEILFESTHATKVGT